MGGVSAEEGDITMTMAEGPPPPTLPRTSLPLRGRFGIGRRHWRRSARPTRLPPLSENAFCSPDVGPVSVPEWEWEWESEEQREEEKPHQRLLSSRSSPAPTAAATLSAARALNQSRDGGRCWKKAMDTLRPPLHRLLALVETEAEAVVLTTSASPRSPSQPAATAVATSAPASRGGTTAASARRR